MDERADAYAPGYADDAVQMMAGRTALARAGPLLPHLRSGMRVLDAGCGPGTITLGLADAVAPGGSVIGIDAEPSQVELARAAAETAGVGNVAFEVASVYDLPYEAAGFDAVFAHGLFEHLEQPVAAFAELRRVLRPGGVAVVVSSDWSAAVVEPRGGDVEAALRGHFELRRRAGGDPDAGGALPALAEQAGLEVDCVERRDEVDLSYPALAAYIAGRLEAAEAAAAPAERSRLAAAAMAARRWQRQPDGMFTQRWVAVVARRT